MADSGNGKQEIETDNSPNAHASGSKQEQEEQKQKSGGFRLWRKKQKKDNAKEADGRKERPADAVKLGCGGLFRRRKKTQQQQEASAEPTDKPSKDNKAAKGGTVKEPAAAAADKEQQQQQLAKGDEAAGAAATAAGPPPPIDTLPTSLPDTPESESLPTNENNSQTDKQLEDGEAVQKAAVAERDKRTRAPAPPRPANPPKAPLVELAKKANTADGKAAEKIPEVEKAAEKTPEVEKAAEKTPEVEKAAEKTPEVEKAAEEEAEGEATGRQHDDKAAAEKERLRLDELRFKQGSVDMSKVAAKPGVKIEQGPHTEMWSSIVNKSFVGTGVFNKAAVCSLASGAVLACNPADFTPTVEQAAALRDNFNNRGVFSAAGFGVADTVYQLQEETATEEILCGADAQHTQAVLACKTGTALLVAVCTERLDRAAKMLADMREHFISQGM